MLTVFVLDCDAQSRTKLLEKLSGYLNESQQELEYVPHIDFQPISLEELSHRERPDLLILGSGLVEKDAVSICSARKRYEGVPILVTLSESLDRLGSIEQIARLGADDTLPPHFSGSDFLKKLVLLTRKCTSSGHSGKLIVVDSGKGGVGVTSVTAALAEASACAGKRVLCIDFDTESQDLSRFLQARPFVNENLQYLLEGSRPVTTELVEQTFAPAWGEAEGVLSCMAPPKLGTAGHGYLARNLLSVLESVDSLFDLTFVDLAGHRGVFERAFFRAADQVLFVVSGDPAALYASVERFQAIRDDLSPETPTLICCNDTKAGAGHRLILRQFGKAIRVEQDWEELTIPYTLHGSRWAASGGTVFSLGNRSVKRAYERLASELGCASTEQGATESRNRFSVFIDRFLRQKPSPEPSLPQQAKLALPDTPHPAPAPEPEEKAEPTYDFPLVTAASLKEVNASEESAAELEAPLAKAVGE